MVLPASPRLPPLLCRVARELGLSANNGGEAARLDGVAAGINPGEKSNTGVGEREDDALQAA